MALIDPAPIDIRIKELHSKKILITMCLFWLEARFAFCDCKINNYIHVKRVQIRALQAQNTALIVKIVTFEYA